ncbi:hypothetical protein [Halorarius halobius]|uniref:hypothetical protein n=1 Tax=Halorarius halobius TaxID=2962671 RepID=UPI0020CBCFF4|nr:hypothetical protein [Halorarius halobius]
MAPPDSLAGRLRRRLDDAMVVGLLVAYAMLAELNALDPYQTEVGLALGALLFVYFAVLQDLMAYPVTAVGTERRVDRDPVDADEGARCDVCGDPIEAGERRTYAEQQVALGVPLRTLEWGENVYCGDCREGEPDADAEEATERDRETE